MQTLAAQRPLPDRSPVLDVHGLKTHFFTRNGVVKAVDGVDLTLAEGEILGLVGESGSGKSITGFSLMGLLDEPAASSKARCCSTVRTCARPRLRDGGSCGDSRSR